MTRYEDLEHFFHDRPSGRVADGRSVEEVGESFGAIEEEFARFLDESLAPRGSESLHDLVGDLQVPAGGVAVDVGCGNGRDAVELARRFDLRVHGIDPMRANVAAATERAHAEGLGAVVDARV